MEDCALWQPKMITSHATMEIIAHLVIIHYKIYYTLINQCIMLQVMFAVVDCALAQSCVNAAIHTIHAKHHFAHHLAKMRDVM